MLSTEAALLHNEIVSSAMVAGSWHKQGQGQRGERILSHDGEWLPGRRKIEDGHHGNGDASEADPMMFLSQDGAWRPSRSGRESLSKVEQRCAARAGSFITE